jgi:hypothetical protein
MERALAEILRKQPFDFAECSRLIFLEQIAGCNQIGRLLARHLDIVGALAVTARKLVN